MPRRKKHGAFNHDLKCFIKFSRHFIKRVVERFELIDKSDGNKSWALQRAKSVGYKILKRAKFNSPIKLIRKNGKEILSFFSEDSMQAYLKNGEWIIPIVKCECTYKAITIFHQNSNCEDEILK